MLTVGILVAVFLATTVVSGIPIYLRSLERVGMADVVKTVGSYNKNVSVVSSWISLDTVGIERADAAVDSAVNDDLEPLVKSRSTRIKSREHFWGINEEKIVRGELASRAYFHEMEGLFDAVTYIEGRSPEANLRTDENGDHVIEVAVYEPRSKQIRHGSKVDSLSVGDVVSATSVIRGAGMVKGEIVGIFVVNDLRNEFWLGSPSAILEPRPPAVFGGRDLPIVLFTAEGAIAPGVGPSNAGLPMNYMRVLFTDPALISLTKPGTLLSSINQFEKILAAEVPRATTLSGLRPSTRRMEQQMLFLRLPVLLLAGLGVAVVGYYLFLVSGLIARRRELEIVLLRSRGFSIFQVVRVQLIEALVTVGIPAGASPLLAVIAIGAMGRLSMFAPLTGGQNLPVELLWASWIWAASTALAAFLAVLIPTLIIARSTVSNLDRQRARPDKPPVFQRLYFDLLVVILGGLFLWEMSSGGVATSDREGEIVTDLTLLYAPVMLLISFALLTLRLFPLLVRAAASVTARFTSASLAIGFWRLGRSPYWYAWPVLLIILGTGLGVLVGTLGSTLERSSREQIFYDNGTNLRITPRGKHTNVRDADIAEISAINGVERATMALRSTAKVGTTGGGPEFTVLGVEAEDFAEMMWFRDDFSDEPVEIILDRIAVSAKPEPLVLPENATTLSAWTKQDPFVQDHFFWVVLEGAEGRRVTVTLGQIGAEWSEQSGDIPEHLVDPIEIISLQTFMQAGGDGGAPTTWSIDDLKVYGPGYEQMLLDFEQPGLWAALPTSNGLDDSYMDISEAPDVGEPGTVTGQVILERGTISGVRGIYRSVTGDPLPVIISDNFVGVSGVEPGREAVVQIYGGFIPVKPVGTVRLFPTLDPDIRPFMIMDVQALLAFVELRGLVDINANEIFLDIDPENRAQTVSSLRQIFMVQGTILDREARIQQSAIDPLVISSWRAMGVVSLIIGGISLAFGYVTYLVAHANRTIHDSAYLRAMGFSKSGFVRISLVEHGIVAVIGVFVGIACGMFASRVAVGAIAYSETGRALLPPFILETSWWPVIAVLLVSTGAACVGLISSFVRFVRTPLHELTRSTE